MKAYISSITLVFFLLSCSSPENKAKKAILEDLKLTMHDFNSYEPVQFGKLEVAMSNWEDSPEVKIYLDKEEACLAKCKEYREKAGLWDFDTSTDSYKNNSKISTMYLDSAKYYNDKIKSVKLHFVPKAIGWQMTHSFRGKSLGGNLGIHQYLFILNKDLTKVTKSVDLSE